MYSCQAKELIDEFVKPNGKFGQDDLHTIYCHLYHMDVLSHLREHQLRSMCTSARYERHEANHILFFPDTIATCWYILLSGSVFVKEHMYLARLTHMVSPQHQLLSSPLTRGNNCHQPSRLELNLFGKQLGGRRGCECITLEPSEMIVFSPVLQVHSPTSKG
ncbi:Rap guanine nucleotide exchange factor 6 PDZ domain-containing guanine nucleotide exchange factor 2 [Collichthys lucidus]|uniref:Rap guanine nucleotide exchange factor 6 PDZ domain-containing guanine nucleotide exchange factor 2 n=1 Tax=Collichthys lucidus TaxID=240159 RepID=A0A4U5V6W9_COLLU|nr:Rap guanine nucleotide exchange factor 6 PDZ domain-containing guanine nucleotide exchange factor 2 [Collichthys lucidus]